MTEVLKAYGRALRSLLQPGILLHLLWPTLVAVAFWIAVAWLGWDAVGAGVERLFIEVGWLNWILQRWEASALAGAIFVKVVLVLLLIPLIYGTALFIVAVFALPLMLERVAAKDYPGAGKAQRRYPGRQHRQRPAGGGRVPRRLDDHPAAVADSRHGHRAAAAALGLSQLPRLQL